MPDSVPDGVSSMDLDPQFSPEKTLAAAEVFIQQIKLLEDNPVFVVRFQVTHKTEFSEHVKQLEYLRDLAKSRTSKETISELETAIEASKKDMTSIDASLAALCSNPTASQLPSACDGGTMLTCTEDAINTKKSEIARLEGELDKIKCELHAKQLEIKQKEYVLNTCEKKLRKKKELQYEARLCALGGGSCGETTSCSKKAGCGCGCGGKKKKTVRRKKKCAKRKVTKKKDAAEPAPVPTRSWGPSQVCFMPQPMMHC